MDMQAVVRICSSGCICRRKKGEHHDITAQKVKGKSGCAERKVKSRTSKPSIGQTPSAVLRSLFIVERSNLGVLQKGAAKMRGVCEIRERLGQSDVFSQRRKTS